MDELTAMSSETLSKTSFLEGGGVMGELIRSYNWADTSLGSPDTWPQSLKTCVRIMLASRQPIWIGWGKELIKLYNDPYLAIVGGKHPWALGKPASVVWKDIWDDIKSMLSTVMEKDEGTYVESQLLIMERNGYPEETYYTFSYTPIPGDEGGTAGMICANTDDTARIIGERQLRTLKELGESLAKMPTVSEVYETALKILAQNQKDFPFAVLYKINNETHEALPIAYAGIGKEQKVFPSAINLVKSEEGTLNFCKAFNTKTIVVSENNGRRRNLPKGAWEVEASHFIHIPIITPGEDVPDAILTAALNPYRIYNETYRQFILLVADQIALEVNNVMAYEMEKKRAEALAEIDRAKTVFFSNISHEFRTPLTLMLGPLEDLLNGNNENLDEASKEKIETTHRNAVRLLRLVNNLLDFSRIEAGREKARFQLTDIAAFTRNLSGNFRSVIENAGLKFLVQCDEIVQPVYVDRTMWEKIVLNLLSNAFKYTLAGSITLSLKLKHDRVELKVKDTGVGIPANELPKMFERFHRVENITGRTHEGTGIGLSLIKELISMHGGNILVRSKLNKGSEFTVAIPTGYHHLAAEQIEESTMDYQTFLSDSFVKEAGRLVMKGTNDTAINRDGEDERRTLLVVDDNVDMREYLQNVLRNRFHVEAAPNGAEALEKIRNHPPDLIISDIMMPVMDGIQLLATLKSDPDLHRIPVILLSARAGEEAKVEGYDIGADDYIVKPFSANELVARVSTQLGIAKKRAAAESQLRDFFKQAPAIIHIMKGPEHRFEFFHPLGKELVGNRDLTGMTIREALPEFEGQGYFELLDEVYRTGKTLSFKEMRSLLKDDKEQLVERYFDFIYRPYLDDDGKVQGVLNFAIDVTDKVSARIKIEESEKKFSTAIDQSPTAIAIIKVPEFSIELLNKKWASRMGADPHTMIGQSLFQAFPLLKEKNLDHILMTTVAGGQAHLEPEYVVDFKRFGKEGIAYFDIVYQPLTDTAGKVTRIMIICHDITELVEARKKIEESESHFRKLADDAPIMIWMATTAKQFSFFNRGWLLFRGKAMEDEAGAGWTEGIHPDDLDRYLEVFNSSFDGRTVFYLEFRLRRSDGIYRWISNTGAPTYSPTGDFTGFIGSCHDINDMREHETRKDDFIRMANHELKTPVTSIKGYVQLLLDSLKHDEKNTLPPLLVKSSLVSIDKQITRLTRLMSELLDLSKIETGQLVLHKAIFSLNELVIDTVQDVLYSNAKHVINIFHETGTKVYGDKDRIGQVLINLLTNAIKYSPNANKIEVWVKQLQPDRVSVSVKDRGIGIDRKFHDKVFERFFRAEGKEEQTYPGFGIGLFIAKEIMQRHDGTISIESEKGEGSTFTFTLPIAHEQKITNG